MKHSRKPRILVLRSVHGLKKIKFGPIFMSVAHTFWNTESLKWNQFETVWTDKKQFRNSSSDFPTSSAFNCVVLSGNFQTTQKTENS